RRKDVRGEHLETRKPLLDHVAELIEGLERHRSQQSDVKRIIDVRIAFPARAALFNSSSYLDRRLEKAEIQMRRRPTEDHSAGIVFRSQGRFTAIGIGQVENVE